MLKRIDDYPAFLQKAWKEHLRPRRKDAPTVISLFAGCGGSSLGYSMAGYRELLAVEWNNNAVETFRLNFSDIPIYHGDIAKLTIDECLQMAKIGQGQLDILDGSPPCQGFSMAGKRDFSDDRNQLFNEYIRFLRGLRPKVFIMENVSGMIKGKMKIIFSEIMQELKESGYRVSARLLNAVYFGVPQSRERMIFIGVREDLEVEPSHPRAESRPMTIVEAWEKVPVSDIPRLSPKLASIIPKIPVWGDGGDVIGSFFSTKRLDFKQPSRTLIKGNIGSRACYIHPSEDRAITEAEAKRIASFPDDYRFIGGYKYSMECIGNSVPPLFMRVIARHIRYEILSKISA